MKTIAAITTPLVPCAIHIIRVSGPNSFEIVNKLITRPITKQAYTIIYNEIIDPHTRLSIDSVLLNLFVKPQSFTGEDTIEINCHGNVVTTQKILELLVQMGCEYAKPGEFSMQALMNNKMNYYQIEAMNNFIHASNQTASQIALQAMHTNDIQSLSKLRDQIFKITGSIEVNIDYPEYDDVPQYSHADMLDLLTPLLSDLQTIYTRSCRLMPVFEGYQIAIVGKPNVGKSSLLNLLAKQDKAIVSNFEGTTRDVVEATINFQGLTVKLQDTAGIRDTLDPLEQMGIDKSKQAIETADLIIWLVDDTYNEIDEAFITLIGEKPCLKVQNKADQNTKANAPILISVVQNEITPLLDALKAKLQMITHHAANEVVLQSHRQISLMQKIILSMQAIIENLKTKTPLDLLQSEFEMCIQDFNSIMGTAFEYDKLDELFKHFCLGK